MRLTLLAAAVLATASACNDPANDANDPSLKPDPLPAMAAKSYPDGPYDIAKGAVIPDLGFSGFANALASSSTLQTIKLGDFYNPHAGDASYQPASADEDDRLFPPGSPYGAGKKKPTALLIDIASVWCGPCNQEAKSVLPGLYAKYHPCGGEFFFQLAQGAMPGTPATAQNIQTWTKVYKVNYPATYDDGGQLRALYSAGNFPDAAVIDTRTMKMIEVIQGVPDDTFWASYEALLDPACLAQQ
jgi:hypothetical protein